MFYIKDYINKHEGLYEEANLEVQEESKVKI